jgi:serine protease
VGDNTTGLHAVPRPLDVELPRLRLVDRLRQRWTQPVTFVVAGPGFGKTTALAQAVRANLLEPRGIDAWVTCGPDHEDATRPSWTPSPRTTVPSHEIPGEEPEQEIIVKFREGASRGDALTRSRTRVVADATDGAEVLASRDAADSIRVLMARGDVVYAEPNMVLEATAVPNDPLWPRQWHYWEATGGTQLSPAWDLGPPCSGQRVAVIDTGRTAHPDMSANYIGGYDFISNSVYAKGGNGRDADPMDQGDWRAAGQCGPGTSARPSSWHGLHVAGTVAAPRNNATGVTGVAPC